MDTDLGGKVMSECRIAHQKRAVANAVLLRRFGNAAGIAGTVAFLCAGRARCTTRQKVSDGGVAVWKG
jgi:NAD(P)-dependent dehydrogenase (short-subunit alcohol dehydrogenase family)